MVYTKVTVMVALVQFVPKTEVYMYRIDKDKKIKNKMFAGVLVVAEEDPTLSFREKYGLEMYCLMFDNMYLEGKEEYAHTSIPFEIYLN